MRFMDQWGNELAEEDFGPPPPIPWYYQLLMVPLVVDGCLWLVAGLVALGAVVATVEVLR